MTAPLLSRLSAPPRKIAIVRASRLGDFVCTTPALRALRAALPQAEIAFITVPLLRELVARSPYIDRFIAFPGYPGIAQQLFSAQRALKFFQRMQAERFDLAIQMQGSGVYANPFTLMLGARATAGFARAEDDASALDAAYVWPQRGHEILRLLELIHHLGIEPCGEATEFPLLAADRRAARDLVAHLPRPLIGIHAGSHDPLRRWPLERFAATARSLLRRYGGTVVLIGGLQESASALELAGTIGPGAYDVTGRTALGTLGALVARLSLLISNDSGPAHIGYALGTPTVTIYRCGGTERYGPLAGGPYIGLEPHPSERAADALVSVSQVLAAAGTLLAAPHRSRPETTTWTSPNGWTGSVR